MSHAGSYQRIKQRFSPKGLYQKSLQSLSKLCIISYSHGKKRLNNQTVNPIPLLTKKLSCQFTSSPWLSWIKLITKAIRLESNKFPNKDLHGFLEEEESFLQKLTKRLLHPLLFINYI
ncbi:MAG: hypothetical protein I3274_02350 [Candidatus Moeniiplasma glomeromycotorum]|nr:hypothetical protein [Candidatus Moeniiplasma glomeromycotorum]MCE8167455.1 hypothetical protein [Candidatus Moeniiplasma glomeromycotorum]